MTKAREGKNLSERDLIAWIRRKAGADAALLKIGPGDDAALAALPSKRLLFTIDTIAEGVDFTLASATPYQIGRKAFAVNLSDIAAMGGRPLFCVASVVLRRGLGGAFPRALYRGLEAMSDSFSCPLAGGDVTAWGDGVVVTVAMAGVPVGGHAITRSGARPGDLVLVTGTLGGSILGKHLKFTPRVAEGVWLASNFPPTAMIDISDGLGVDSAHISEESKVALHIEETKVPVSAAARRRVGGKAAGAMAHALSDGEDFELLFTMPAPRAQKCAEKWPFSTRLTVIGSVREGRGVHLLRPGRQKERIDTEGYEHS